MGNSAMRPLASVLREIPGRWVAVDRSTGEPKAVAATHHELAAAIRAERLTNVAVVRAPDPTEPELVGFG